MGAPDSADMSESHRGYDADIRGKVRVATLAARMRASGIQALWLVVIVAGAGVPLNRSLDGPGWVEPLLGFVVVVAAGVERIFQRTTAAAVATDELRRRLAHERRLFLAGTGPYADPSDRFERYAERSESLIVQYDRAMVDHGRSLLGLQR